MIVTDSKELKKYADDKRLWQGIPGIEVTKKGRIFVTFYSGGTAEQAGNYVLLFQSDGKGAFNRSLSKTLTDAREILYAKITEDDIIRGEIVTPGSCLKMMVNKLKEYRGDDPNPYNE